MPILKIYNEDKELILVSQEFQGYKGWGLLTDLLPNTTYEEGTYFVSWEDKDFESEKIPVPRFTTESNTNKELVFYFKDALTVEPMTAYDIAVRNGFTGTELEWVKSIKGEKGDSGLNLTQGGSAYEYALDNGFEGTVDDWLKSLKGDKGDKGVKGEPGDTKELKEAQGSFQSLKNIVNLPLQDDFINQLEKITTTTDNITVSIVHAPSQTFHAVQPISDTKALRVWFYKNTKDDYIIMRETEIGDFSLQNQSIGFQNLKIEDSSLFDTNYPPNYFAKTTGATLTGTFVADRIDFVSYCTNAGGIWEAILDEGSIYEKKTTVSTYSENPIVDKEQLLFDELEYKQHTLKLVFKGQDPNHPVSAPRGWFNYGGQRTQDVKGTVNIYKLVPVLSNPTLSLYSYSNKEFAMQVRDASETEGEQFVPEHNGIGSAFKNSDAKLLGDGETLEFITGRVYHGIKSLSLLQNVNGTVNGIPLINIVTNHTLEKGNVNIFGYMNFLKDTYVKTGYTGMLPYFTENVNNIKSSIGNLYTPNVSGQYKIEYIPEKLQAKSYLLSSSDNNIVSAITFDSFLSTMRIEENNLKGDTWLEHRSAAMGKLYNQQFKDETVQNGTEYRFKLIYRTTETPYANLLF